MRSRINALLFCCLALSGLAGARVPAANEASIRGYYNGTADGVDVLVVCSGDTRKMAVGALAGRAKTHYLSLADLKQDRQGGDPKKRITNKEWIRDEVPGIILIARDQAMEIPQEVIDIFPSAKGIPPSTVHVEEALLRLPKPRPRAYKEHVCVLIVAPNEAMVMAEVERFFGAGTFPHQRNAPLVAKYTGRIVCGLANKAAGVRDAWKPTRAGSERQETMYLTADLSEASLAAHQKWLPYEEAYFLTFEEIQGLPEALRKRIPYDLKIVERNQLIAVHEKRPDLSAAYCFVAPNAEGLGDLVARFTLAPQRIVDKMPVVLAVGNKGAAAAAPWPGGKVRSVVLQAGLAMDQINAHKDWFPFMTAEAYFLTYEEIKDLPEDVRNRIPYDLKSVQPNDILALKEERGGQPPSHVFIAPTADRLGKMVARFKGEPIRDKMPVVLAVAGKAAEARDAWTPKGEDPVLLKAGLSLEEINRHQEWLPYADEAYFLTHDELAALPADVAERIPYDLRDVKPNHRIAARIERDDGAGRKGGYLFIAPPGKWLGEVVKRFDGETAIAEKIPDLREAKTILVAGAKDLTGDAQGITPLLETTVANLLSRSKIFTGGVQMGSVSIGQIRDVLDQMRFQEGGFTKDVVAQLGNITPADVLIWASVVTAEGSTTYTPEKPVRVTPLPGPFVFGENEPTFTEGERPERSKEPTRPDMPNPDRKKTWGGYHYPGNTHAERENSPEYQGDLNHWKTVDLPRWKEKHDKWDGPERREWETACRDWDRKKKEFDREHDNWVDRRDKAKDQHDKRCREMELVWTRQILESADAAIGIQVRIWDLRAGTVIWDSQELSANADRRDPPKEERVVARGVDSQPVFPPAPDRKKAPEMPLLRKALLPAIDGLVGALRQDVLLPSDIPLELRAQVVDAPQPPIDGGGGTGKGPEKPDDDRGDRKAASGLAGRIAAIEGTKVTIKPQPGSDPLAKGDLLIACAGDDAKGPAAALLRVVTVAEDAVTCGHLPLIAAPVELKEGMPVRCRLDDDPKPTLGRVIGTSDSAVLVEVLDPETASALKPGSQMAVVYSVEETRNPEGEVKALQQLVVALKMRSRAGLVISCPLPPEPLLARIQPGMAVRLWKTGDPPVTVAKPTPPAKPAAVPSTKAPAKPGAPSANKAPVKSKAKAPVRTKR